MKPIKTIAGRLLIYFYSLQRTDYSKLHDLMLNFQMRRLADRNEKAPKIISASNETVKNLSALAGSDIDIYNALKYLADKEFVGTDIGYDEACEKFSAFRVVSGGIDIIEGIERGEEEKKLFYAVFNIKLKSDMDIEGLMKKYI